MPHLHEGADDPLGFAVGLWPVNLGEFLADVMRLAGHGKSVDVGTPVLLAVVRVRVFNLVRALRQHVVDEKMAGAVLGLVWQDVGVQFAGEVVDGDEQVFPGRRGRLSLEQWQTLGIEVDEFAGVGFVIAPGGALQLVLDGLLNLGQPFKAVAYRPEALVGTVAGGELLHSGAFQHGVDGWPRYPEMLR